MAALFGDAAVMRYVGDRKPFDAEQSAAALEKIFAICDSDSSSSIWAIEVGDEYAGHAELRRRHGRPEFEIVYLLQQQRWGRSLGGHVVDAILAEAAARALPFVVATVYPENAASLAILRRRGFSEDADLSRERAVLALRLDLP
jgi:RimJ/RimL family protein N-acetyltransferase